MRPPAGCAKITSPKTGIPVLGDVILAQPAGGRIENLEGVGELEEKMQMLMQRFSFLETV